MNNPAYPIFINVNKIIQDFIKNDTLSVITKRSDVFKNPIIGFC
jgi:hypothetical protein